MLYKNTQERENEQRLLCEILGYMMTNEKAEKSAIRLIEEFGCIKNIFSAEIPDLKTCTALTEAEAVMLSFVGKFMGYVAYEKFGENPVLTDAETRKRFVSTIVGVMPYEDFYIMLLDEKGRMIKTVPISHGNETAITISVRFITDTVMKFGAKGVIAVHTHPAGSLQPSHEDIQSTYMLAELLKKLEVQLVDHIIVGRNGVCSMKELNMF